MAILLLGAQITSIISFFLSRNIRVARQRAWDQTVASRGKGADFWQPYVEEWDVPPIVDETLSGRMSNKMTIWTAGVVVKKSACIRSHTSTCSEILMCGVSSVASSVVLVSVRRYVRSGRL